MRGDDTRRGAATGLPDAALWRRSQTVEITEEAAEAERYLDLAGFTDECLDPDERQRVAELLTQNPVAAGDVAAARELLERADVISEPAIARAAALVLSGVPRSAAIIPFRPRRRNRPSLPAMARWGSLVAAMAVASWLGFTLGVDASLSFSQISQSGEDSAPLDLLDPAAGLMRDLIEGSQT